MTVPFFIKALKSQTVGVILSALLCFLCGITQAPMWAKPSTEIEQAKELFQRYVSLEEAYDVTLADLYAEDAVIQSVQKYPDGTAKTLHIPMTRYRMMIQQLMPMAKLLEDKGRYSKVTYQQQGERVEIQAIRSTSVPQKYSAPLTLIVGPNDVGQWVIFEEHSQTQPAQDQPEESVE